MFILVQIFPSFPYNVCFVFQGDVGNPGIPGVDGSPVSISFPILIAYSIFMNVCAGTSFSLFLVLLRIDKDLLIDDNVDVFKMRYFVKHLVAVVWL